MKQKEKESVYMDNHTFYVDRKVTIWVRERHQVEAETYEEAEKQMIESFKDNSYDNTFVEQDWLYDTQEDLEPVENNGFATIEMYSEDKPNVLIDNL
jgi:hypothetical protein